MITVYSLPICPNCNVLKNTLKGRDIEFEEKDLDTPETKTKLLMAGVFTVVAPVLQINNTFYVYNQIFNESGAVKDEILQELK